MAMVCLLAINNARLTYWRYMEICIDGALVVSSWKNSCNPLWPLLWLPNKSVGVTGPSPWQSRLFHLQRPLGETPR